MYVSPQAHRSPRIPPLLHGCCSMLHANRLYQLVAADPRQTIIAIIGNWLIWQAILPLLSIKLTQFCSNGHRHDLHSYLLTVILIHPTQWLLFKRMQARPLLILSNMLTSHTTCQSSRRQCFQCIGKNQSMFTHLFLRHSSQTQCPLEITGALRPASTAIVDVYIASWSCYHLHNSKTGHTQYVYLEHDICYTMLTRYTSYQI